MKYIGIDYGTKKTGFAISDELGLVAFPKEVLPTDKFLPSFVAGIIVDEKVGGIVIGESRNLSGGLNTVADDTRAFVSKLVTLIDDGVEVHYEDERFTTKQARTLPREGSIRGDVANRKLGKGVSKQADAQAAALILQAFLDKRKNLS